MPRVTIAIALLLSAVGLAACGSSAGGSSGEGKHLTLVAYSTPQSAYEQLISAYEQTSAGKGSSFSQSYGPSGEQSRAVSNGLHADVVNFSLEPDVERLVKSGMVSAEWNKNATHGFVTDSVAVLIVRKGNPKHIATWSDLTKPGVQVLTPNPFTSGSARWNVLAAYGAALKEGKTPAQAEASVSSLFHHVVSQDSSARNALQTFIAGRGDVLIDYESEAIADQKKSPGQIEYVIPPATILIQNPAAVVGSGGSAPEAKKFIDFLVSPAAQQIWVSHGYRPVTEGVAGASKFPTPAQLFTVESLGGWKTLGKRFFDPEAGIVTKIEQSLGVPTSK
jgi:sulfate transport system substrate-binding protein